MEELHVSILSEILYRIPLEFVVSCKLVSKKWNDILSQRKFSGTLFLVGSYWERNLQLYYGNISNILETSDPEQFSYKNLIKMKHPLVNKRKVSHPENFMVGSCNGLVCFSVPHHCINDPVYVTNPISGEYVNLPRLHPKCGRVVSGFGYLCSSNEYKVVRIFYPDQEDNNNTDNSVGVGWVQIYTLGGNNIGWRNIGDITYALFNEGMFLDGSLHWMEKSEGKILAFDLADEEFQVISPLPCGLGSYSSPHDHVITPIPCSFGTFSSRHSLKILRGHLCLVHHQRLDCLYILSFKSKQQSKCNYDEKEIRWILESSIPTPNRIGIYDPFSLNENNEEVLLWLDQTTLCTCKSYGKPMQALGSNLMTQVCGLAHGQLLARVFHTTSGSTTILCSKYPRIYKYELCKTF